MMAYHQGLLRKGDLGIIIADYYVKNLLKIGGPLVTGDLGLVIGEVLEGLVRKKQTGKGIIGDVLKGGYGIT